MGRPLAHVPDPEADGHESYARHFAGLFLDTFARLGVHPDRVYWMSEVYAAGEMDRYIRIALDRAAAVRDIYRRVANVQPSRRVAPAVGDLRELRADRDDHRHRLGRGAGALRVPSRPGGLGDGLRPCRRHLARSAGAPSCPFNVDWAAKWSLFGVTIEPNGKDLGTKGGARDRSEAIAREVFDREPPLNVVYEFLNIGGRKMSTSKGRGAAAHLVAEVMPPEQLRLLFLRPRYNQAIDFDPDGTDAIPRLFDESDRLAAAVAGHEVKGELPSDPEHVFARQPGRPRCRSGRRGGGLPTRRSPTWPCSSRSPAWTWPSASPPRRGRRSPSASGRSSTSA